MVLPVGVGYEGDKGYRTCLEILRIPTSTKTSGATIYIKSSPEAGVAKNGHGSKFLFRRPEDISQ